MIDGTPSEPDTKSAVDADALADSTLGGYLAHHVRPPAFEGLDGHPYTVSPEVEKTPDLTAPFSGYLVFPRWADTGAGACVFRQREGRDLQRGGRVTPIDDTYALIGVGDVGEAIRRGDARRVWLRESADDGG